MAIIHRSYDLQTSSSTDLTMTKIQSKNKIHTGSQRMLRVNWSLCTNIHAIAS